MKISLGEIAEMVGGHLNGEKEKMISGTAPFEHAGDDHIVLAGSVKFLKKINDSNAGAFVIPENNDLGLQNTISVKNPQVAFAKIVSFFHPSSINKYYVSPDAFIGNNFTSGSDIMISQLVSIGDNVTIGNRVRLHPGIVIEDNVIIGDDVEIHPNVTICRQCEIGNRVIIHSGTVIGSDGFGFAPDGEKYHKIPHTGIVCIDDDVEIGALNAIDRATFGKTWIKQGVKTDNLVHIAHNVIIGENSIIVAQVGISGSTSIGKSAILAGQAGVSGHLTIGDNVIIGPQAGIAKSISDGEIVSGSPEIPHKLWLRVQNIIPKLPELKKKISELEKRLKKVEEK